MAFTVVGKCVLVCWASILGTASVYGGAVISVYLVS